MSESTTVDMLLALFAHAAWGNRAVLDGLRSSPAAALDREVTYTNSAGRTFSNRAVDILLHVALHGSHHRGMVSSLTRRSGGTAAPTDFIAWVRGVPTATRADAEQPAVR